MGLINVEKIGHVKVVTLNRPEASNSLSSELVSSFNQVLDEVELDKNIRVMVITGTGRSFCAGADLKQRRKFNAEQKWLLLLDTIALFDRIEMIEVPTIAAINGYALGGGMELAMACDIRIASENCIMGLPEITMANYPGGGAPLRLPRIIGVGKAKELLFSGRRITADEADKIGFLEKVVPPDKAREEALLLAEMIAENGPLAMRQLKKLIDSGLRTNRELGEKLSLWLREPLDASEDYLEGLEAQAEKRKPVYKGR